VTGTVTKGYGSVNVIGLGECLNKSLIRSGFLDISVRQQADCHVVKLRGNLRLGQAVDALKKLFDELTASNYNDVVLNLEEVPSMDSSGIGVVVRALTTAKAHGGSLKLVNPSGMVTQTLKLVAVLNLFEVFDNEQDAVESFG
jgi:anti-sigma B factor antagonist